MNGQKKLLLAVDLRCLPTDGSEGAGVEHVARELFAALVRQAENTNVEIVGLAARGAKVEPKDHIIWLKNHRGNSLRFALALHRYDALLVPAGAVPLGITLPTYPLVHDVAIFQHSEWFPQSYLKRLLTTSIFQIGLKKAKHIFSVSDDTKYDMVKRLGISSDKITTVYQALEHIDQTWQPNHERPYALILGTVQPRKNIPFITSWWGDLTNKDANPHLVIAGRTGWGNVQLPKKKWLERISVMNDEQRLNLFRAASIVLIPSLHEGFSRVALEAMTVGVPLIVSDGGALPEIVKDGGLVLPLEAEKWKQAVRQVLADPTMSDELSQRGQSRAKAFSWPKIASEILAKIVETC